MRLRGLETGSVGDDPGGDRDSAESGKDGKRIFLRRMTVGDQWPAVSASA
jgi:hypothetical protein